MVCVSLRVCLLLLLDPDRLYYTEDSLRPDEKDGGWEGYIALEIDRSM